MLEAVVLPHDLVVERLWEGWELEVFTIIGHC
jgi:hypothetical protein